MVFIITVELPEYFVLRLHATDRKDSRYSSCWDCPERLPAESHGYFGRGVEWSFPIE